MADEDPENQEAERRRRTVYLLLGGALSLLIPLLIVLYLHISESPAAGSGTNHPGFVTRKNWGEKIKPAVTPAPMAKSLAAPAGDSLGFIKGSPEYYPPAQARQTSLPANPEAAAHKQAAPPAPKSATTAQKQATPGYKPFTQPKLHLSNSGLGNPTQIRPGQMPPGLQTGQMPPGMPDMNALLKNIPGAGATGTSGTPDINKLLQGVSGDTKQKQ